MLSGSPDEVGSVTSAFPIHRPGSRSWDNRRVWSRRTLDAQGRQHEAQGEAFEAQPQNVEAQGRRFEAPGPSFEAPGQTFEAQGHSFEARRQRFEFPRRLIVHFRGQFLVVAPLRHISSCRTRRSRVKRVQI
jgi:hypothetical protein